MSSAKAKEETEERIGLHNLKPSPGSRRPRKRVGRGEGSGTGKTSGRGQKGAGSRSGSKRRARFEGGQMPIHMRMRKLRGPHMKKSMPFEMFRTHTQPVNIADLDAALRVRRRGHRRAAEGEGTWYPQGHTDQDPRQGRADKAAHGARPCLQRQRTRAHRGCRRHLPHRRELESGTPRTTLVPRPQADALDDPQRLPGSGYPQEARLHRGACC